MDLQVHSVFTLPLTFLFAVNHDQVGPREKFFSSTFLLCCVMVKLCMQIVVTHYRRR